MFLCWRLYQSTFYSASPCFSLPLCWQKVILQVIPFDTASNFLHKRTDHLDTSVSDAKLYYGDSDAALACKMYVLILLFLQLLFVGIRIFEWREFHRKQFDPRK
jgi:hypothetical protein